MFAFFFAMIDYKCAYDVNWIVVHSGTSFKTGLLIKEMCWSNNPYKWSDFFFLYFFITFSTICINP